MIPLYSIFAVDCVRRVSNWLRSSLRAPNLPDWSIEIGLVLLAVGLAAYAKSRSPSSSYGFEYPPKPSPIVEVLKVQTGLVPGADFRGRAVTLTGRNIDRPIGWLDLHGQDAARANEIGNEHRVSGLSYFDIPHLFPYGASLPLAYHVLVSRLLARPGDREMRNVEVLREFNPTILRMLGARYVIADGEIGESAELRATATAGRDGNLYLYELPEPNLGQFSPTSATRVDNATELMRRLRDPAFDPMSEILVQQPRAGAFVPARDTSLVYEGVTLRYRAKSDAQSLALLPVDFSHCLTIDSPSGGAVQIFRANLALTGLQFSGAIDIRITTHTGPFDHPACLLADRNELAALRLADVPLP
jgi:hypothetical protein